MESCRSRQLLGRLDSIDHAFSSLFPGLDLIGAFICEADLLVEIRLDELKIVSSGTEKDVVELRDCLPHLQHIEHLPHRDKYHINN